MLEQVLQTLLGEVQKISRAETVIGEPVRCGDSTLIPISRVHIGFAAGVAGKTAVVETTRIMHISSKTRVPGGIRVEPVACVVVDQSGKAQLLQLSHPEATTFGKMIDLLPEVLDRLGLKRQEPVVEIEGKKQKNGDGKKSQV